MRNVDFFYGDHQVLKNVSFSVHRGERISVVGKNGAGKSTIARLVCGIIRPKNGEVQLKGQNYMKMSIRDIGRMVGYVMQNPNQMIVKDMIRDEVLKGKLPTAQNKYSVLKFLFLFLDLGVVIHNPWLQIPPLLFFCG